MKDRRFAENGGVNSCNNIVRGLSVSLECFTDRMRPVKCAGLQRTVSVCASHFYEFLYLFVSLQNVFCYISAFKANLINKSAIEYSNGNIK